MTQTVLKQHKTQRRNYYKYIYVYIKQDKDAKSIEIIDEIACDKLLRSEIMYYNIEEILKLYVYRKTG